MSDWQDTVNWCNDWEYGENCCDGASGAKQTAWKRKQKVCMYCGAKHLRWVKTDSGWRLFELNGGDLHVCNKHPSMEKKHE